MAARAANELELRLLAELVDECELPLRFRVASDGYHEIHACDIPAFTWGSGLSRTSAVDSARIRLQREGKLNSNGDALQRLVTRRV